MSFLNVNKDWQQYCNICHGDLRLTVILRLQVKIWSLGFRGRVVQLRISNSVSNPAPINPIKLNFNPESQNLRQESQITVTPCSHVIRRKRVAPNNLIRSSPNSSSSSSISVKEFTSSASDGAASDREVGLAVYLFPFSLASSATPRAPSFKQWISPSSVPSVLFVHVHFRGVGAGPAGPAAAGPIF